VSPANTGLTWLTVAAYWVAALACGVCAASVRSIHPGASRKFWFWAGVAVLMFFLGVNKQWGLDRWFAIEGRELAKEEGRYMQRRELQVPLVIAITVCGMAAAGFLLRSRRAMPECYKCAFAALGFLVCFIAVRAVSYHYVDLLLMIRWRFLTVNALIENAAIFGVCISALWTLQTERGRG
jgi:hypothetical protein